MCINWWIPPEAWRHHRYWKYFPLFALASWAFRVLSEPWRPSTASTSTTMMAYGGASLILLVCISSIAAHRVLVRLIYYVTEKFFRKEKIIRPKKVATVEPQQERDNNDLPTKLRHAPRCLLIVFVWSIIDMMHFEKIPTSSMMLSSSLLLTFNKKLSRTNKLTTSCYTNDLLGRSFSLRGGYKSRRAVSGSSSGYEAWCLASQIKILAHLDFIALPPACLAANQWRLSF